MAAYSSSFTEVKHAEFTRTIWLCSNEKIYDSADGKSLYVATKWSNWRIKWVLGVAHLPVAALWKEISTIPIGQNLRQMKKSVMVWKQFGI